MSESFRPNPFRLAFGLMRLPKNQDGSIDYVDSVDAAPQPEPVPVTAEIVQEAPQQPEPMPEPPLPEEPPFVDDDDFASLMS